MNRNPLAIVVSCTLIAVATPADAHVFLSHSEPKIGSSVQADPQTVAIWFDGPVQPSCCRLEVRCRDMVVSEGTCSVAPNDPTCLRVPIRAVGPGRYEVTWCARATCGHRSHGKFAFTVTREPGLPKGSPPPAPPDSNKPG